MFSRIKKTLRDANLFGATRFSRFIAGGMTGIFFCLDTIFKVPLKDFLSGWGPVGTTLATSGAVFLVKAKENCTVTSVIADSFSHDLKHNQELNSLLTILQMLRRKEAATRSMCRSTTINAQELLTWNTQCFSAADLEVLKKILIDLYNALQKPIKKLEKYSACFFWGALQFVGHYSELMLLRAYRGDLTPVFDTDNLADPKNFLCLLLTLIAFQNAYGTFIDTKNLHENPDLGLLKFELSKKLEEELVPIQLDYGTFSEESRLVSNVSRLV